MTLVAPSILSSNFSNISSVCELINKSQADYYHIDVMDGVFVPNITFGMPIVKTIKELAEKPLDIHLMIINPERYIAAFFKAGADILTVHYEACTHLDSTIGKIKELGMKAGVAINPHTSVELLAPIIHLLDMVTLMSVNPGFGGQKFIPYTINKIRRLKEMIAIEKTNTKIEIDGGVTLNNVRDIVSAGVDVLVAGNTIYSSNEPKKIIKQLKNIK